MLAALQLLETKGKVLPDGKIENIVTLTVKDKVTACVIDWDDIVDGWSENPIEILSSYTPPGAMYIRDTLRAKQAIDEEKRACPTTPPDEIDEDKRVCPMPAPDEIDAKIRTLCFLKHTGSCCTVDLMGYLSSYFMIGCVFTSAVTLYDRQMETARFTSSPLFWWASDNACNSTAEQITLDTARDKYIATVLATPSTDVLYRLAVCLNDFKKKTLQCIYEGLPSRPSYNTCILDMMAICKTPSIHEEARDYSVPTNSTSRKPTKWTGRFKVTDM